jgi:hypothetical protein
MKKIILVVIAIAILALFAGCDAILEGFFPEFADTNSIDVFVEISDLRNTDDYPVIVALIPLDNTLAPIEQLIVKQKRFEHDFYVSFDGIPNGKYQVYGWWDSAPKDGYLTSVTEYGGAGTDAIEKAFAKDALGQTLIEFTEDSDPRYKDVTIDFTAYGGMFVDPSANISDALNEL